MVNGKLKNNELIRLTIILDFIIRRITLLLYTLSLRLYFLIILVVSPFNHKAKLWLDGRKNIFEKLRNTINKDDKIIWVHCSSLGEFEQGRPVIEAIKKKKMV